MTHPFDRNLPASVDRYPYSLRTLMELLDIGPGVALSALVLVATIVVVAVVSFIRSAPPTHISFSSGPEGSVFQKNALKYAKILESKGVHVHVLTSQGSLENLKRLKDPQSDVDVAMVQAGLESSEQHDLVSLGSISYQPILIFYRGAHLELLSELANRTIAIGPLGSGTRKFALSLLEANGVREEGKTKFLNAEGVEAAHDLATGQVDAAFIMSEGSSSEILHQLLRSQEVTLFNFKQANAYSRKIDYLNILELPEGAIDLGHNIPAHDISLLGPMVEVIATPDLHPALSDLLLEAMTQVHSRPGTFQKRGEFPAPIEHSVHMSDDATRFYKSGKSLIYRYLPFWLASLVSRIIVVFLPMLVFTIPIVRSIPAFFRWRTQTKIHRRYRELLTLEQAFQDEKDTARRLAMREDFDRIASAVNKMKVRASFADQLYGLRGHIDYVRQYVMKA